MICYFEEKCVRNKISPKNLETVFQKPSTTPLDSSGPEVVGVCSSEKAGNSLHSGYKYSRNEVNCNGNGNGGQSNRCLVRSRRNCSRCAINGFEALHISIMRGILGQRLRNAVSPRAPTLRRATRNPSLLDSLSSYLPLSPLFHLLSCSSPPLPSLRQYSLGAFVRPTPISLSLSLSLFLPPTLSAPFHSSAFVHSHSFSVCRSAKGAPLAGYGPTLVPSTHFLSLSLSTFADVSDESLLPPAGFLSSSLTFVRRYTVPFARRCKLFRDTLLTWNPFLFFYHPLLTVSSSVGPRRIPLSDLTRVLYRSRGCNPS